MVSFTGVIRSFVTATIALLVVGLVTGTVSAAILTGSGPNLPIPTPNPAWPPGVSPTQIDFGGTFTGTWAAPADPDWVGTYNATGPIPGAFAVGTTRYDFTTLPLGYLPAGTFFLFGDVDGGSTNAERFDLQALDGSGNAITSEWLGAATGPNSTHAVRGPGTGTGGTVLPGNTPGWDWDLTNADSYHVTGATVTGGNPNVAVALVTNQPIHQLLLNKPTTHYSFSLQAPSAVPEPASLLLALAGGCPAWLFYRRRRAG